MHTTLNIYQLGRAVWNSSFCFMTICFIPTVARIFRSYLAGVNGSSRTRCLVAPRRCWVLRTRQRRAIHCGWCRERGSQAEQDLQIREDLRLLMSWRGTMAELRKWLATVLGLAAWASSAVAPSRPSRHQPWTPHKQHRIVREDGAN